MFSIGKHTPRRSLLSAPRRLHGGWNPPSTSRTRLDYCYLFWFLVSLQFLRYKSQANQHWPGSTIFFWIICICYLYVKQLNKDYYWNWKCCTNAKLPVIISSAGWVVGPYQQTVRKEFLRQISVCCRASLRFRKFLLIQVIRCKSYPTRGIRSVESYGLTVRAVTIYFSWTSSARTSYRFHCKDSTWFLAICVGWWYHYPYQVIDVEANPHSD